MRNLLIMGLLGFVVFWGRGEEPPKVYRVVASGTNAQLGASTNLREAMAIAESVNPIKSNVNGDDIIVSYIDVVWPDTIAGSGQRIRLYPNGDWVVVND